MKRINFTIEEKQIEKLKKHYLTSGIRMSEAVRKAIDLYFKKIEQQKKG